jgi:2-methylcitrate dehydratase PrpD
MSVTTEQASATEARPAHAVVQAVAVWDRGAEVKSYPGFPTCPFTWDDIVAKFDKLVAGRADEILANEIKAAARPLETIQVRDLTGLLARVNADQRG